MPKIKIADSLCILEEGGSVYQAVFTSTRRIKRFKVDLLAKNLLEMTVNPCQFDDLIKKLEESHNRADILSCINTFKGLGILNIYPEDEVPARYMRQLTFINELASSWDETIALQKKIESSTVSVFGVGGIGTWIVNGLAQIGVGTIKISDPDIITETNLNRQLHFYQKDIGRYKVDVIKEKLTDANIHTFKVSVSSESSLDDIIKDCNFMVDCADFPSVADTARVIDTYAKRYLIPYSIAGGYNMHLGMVGPIIIPGKSACFDCFLEYQKDSDPLKDFKKLKDVEQTGSLGPIAGVIGNLQAMEIFKFLIGKGELNINRFAELDFMNLSLEWRNYNKRKDCITCKV